MGYVMLKVRRVHYVFKNSPVLKHMAGLQCVLNIFSAVTPPLATFVRILVPVYIEIKWQL